MDEEDGQVLPLELEAEKKARIEAIDNFRMDRELEAIKKGEELDDWDKDIYNEITKEDEEAEKAAGGEEKVQVVESASGEKTIRAAHVPVPTQVKYSKLKAKNFFLKLGFTGMISAAKKLNTEISVI